MTQSDRTREAAAVARAIHDTTCREMGFGDGSHADDHVGTSTCADRAFAVLPALSTPPPSLRPVDLDLFDQRIKANAQMPSIAGYELLVTDLRAALEGAPDDLD